ncbi:hypothetical protein NKH18_38265 [Streptomyces sp. M10(2022)]
MVTRADRTGAGNVITAYGSSGIKGPSGPRHWAACPPTRVRRLRTLTWWRAEFQPRTATWPPQSRSDEEASTMKITIGDWTVMVTGEPLRLTPRFDFRDFRVRIAEYSNVEERGAFLLDTFGSGPWLWDTPDELRFDREDQELVGAEFQVAGEAADPEDSARLSATPIVDPGGLRADEARTFTWR